MLDQFDAPFKGVSALSCYLFEGWQDQWERRACEIAHDHMLFDSVELAEKCSIESYPDYFHDIMLFFFIAKDQYYEKGIDGSGVQDETGCN